MVRKIKRILIFHDTWKVYTKLKVQHQEIHLCISIATMTLRCSVTCKAFNITCSLLKKLQILDIESRGPDLGLTVRGGFPNELTDKLMVNEVENGKEHSRQKKQHIGKPYGLKELAHSKKLLGPPLTLERNRN